MKYKFLDDLTSDVCFEVYGKDLKELFANAAEALFSVICDIEKIEAQPKQLVKVQADNIEELLINWLQELIALVDIEHVFYSKFDIKEIDEQHVVAECHGEEATPSKSGTVVKAVTYYKFRLEQDKKGYKATVSLDI